MAFPAVESSAPYNGTTLLTSHSVLLPATVSAGSLLVIFGRVPSDVSGVLSLPAGWVKTLGSDVSTDTAFWAYRTALAAGSEDGTAVAVGVGSEKLAAVSVSITGAQDPATQAPQSSTIATGASGTTTVDPTGCTPTGGAKDYLWIAVGTGGAEFTSPPATIPGSYGGSVGGSTGTAGTGGTNCNAWIATRQLNAASEDPGSWTLSAACGGWVAWTLAVHPAGAAAAAFVPRMIAVY